MKRILRKGTSILVMLFMVITQIVILPQVANAAVRGSWTCLNGSTSISQAMGMAIDSYDNIYVADRGNGKVRKLVNATNTWEDLNYTGRPPVCVAVDSLGNVYVGDNWTTAKIWELPAGDSTWKEITYDATLWYINGITVDNSGNVYVTTGTSTNRILKLQSGGTSWVPIDDGTTTFSRAAGICTDNSDNIYVTDAVGNKIWKSQNGGTTWDDITYSGGNFDYPTGIFIDGNNNLYVADGNSGKVKVLTNGRNTWTDETTSNLLCIWGVVKDSAGNLYGSSCDVRSGGVYKYEPAPPATYTVSFDSQGGSAVSSVPNVTEGATIDAPTDPTKSGYFFDGWYTETECTNQWDFLNDPITADTTLYAKWTRTTNITADAANNYVNLSPNPVMCGNSVIIEAVGDRQSAHDITVGNVNNDECYIPEEWSSDDGTTGSFNFSGGSYTASYTPSIAGSHTITVNFGKYYWSDYLGQWQGSEDSDTKTTSLTVDAASTTANAANNSISLSPSSVTAGSSVTITATGDRQSAYGILVGNVDDDECFIPVEWSSDDGTTGSFNFSGGSYTASYTPSTDGSHTITVIYQLYEWDDTSNLWRIQEFDDTKTTSLTVNATGTTPSAVTVEGVNSLSDITVANGTKKSDIGLPETVDVTLSDGAKTSAAVIWDNGSPAYDGDTAQTYTFTGTLTLPDGVTNPNNYKVSVKVIVQAESHAKTPAAVRIEGTKRVGKTLTAQLKDADGNNYATSAAVTYEWYRLDNSDSEFINEIGTGKTFKLTKSDLRKYIGVRATCGQYSFKYIIGRISESSSSSSSSSSSKSSSSTEEITVRVTDGSNDKSISKAAIQRITASDGTKKDTVTYTAEKARETIIELLNQGKDIARIVTITEEDAKVSETKINIPNDTLSALSNGNLNLEIETSGVIIAVPKTTVQDLSKNGQLSEDLYFRVVPIKDEAKQQEIKTTANKEMVIKAVSGKDGVQVLGTPMTIETNMTRENVEIVLPLKGVTIPSDPAEREAFLKDLGVFIEHSDGEKVLQKGEIVEYAQGVYGIKFTVNKFSDFTIVKLNQDASVGEGWKNDSQGWKYIKNGIPAIGWNQINGVWYLMDLTGIMQTGWKEVNGVWYYLNDSGAMTTGWVQSNGEWYYLYSDGAMASNTIIEGYTLGTSGAWIH